MIEIRYSFGSDIFSFGVVLYFVVSGRFPYSVKELKSGIDSIQLDFIGSIPEGVCELIFSMMDKESKNRADIIGAISTIFGFGIK
jgi:serine/threonine protein kinase